MPLPPMLQQKYLNRFRELISEGQSIHEAIKTVRGGVIHNEITGRDSKGHDCHVVDWARFVEWKTKCVSLLSKIIPQRSAQWPMIEQFRTLACEQQQLEFGISVVKAIQDDFAQGFLDDLQLQIEAEIAADYMRQAEGLLQDGQPGKFDHIPAAVLAGAVLEKTLRTLNGQQQPPIAIKKADGSTKTLSLLIDDLKKAGVYNELKAKQLRGWADIRNSAAHGNFDDFTSADARQMISGINIFLADHLK